MCGLEAHNARACLPPAPWLAVSKARRSQGFPNLLLKVLLRRGEDNSSSDITSGTLAALRGGVVLWKPLHLLTVGIRIGS